MENPIQTAPRAHSELDAPLSSKRMVVNLGPSHPAMHGVTRAVVELDGEIITDMKLDIGFLHRGFEKSCENVTWTQCFPYTDRLNYVSATMNNVGFAMAALRGTLAALLSFAVFGLALWALRRQIGDYTYADMDGHTTDITRAAEIAASKGILVVNAVGNEGQTAWHYLIAPADVHGDSLIAVGSVSTTGAPAATNSPAR